jgi:hypothetical protein
MAYRLYDYADHKGNRIQEWAKGQPKIQLDKLNNRLDVLERAEPYLAEQLIEGTGVASIFKIKVQGNPKLRPMLCRGPANKATEFTLLIGAREIQFQLVPPASDAAQRRQSLIQNATLRVPHERFKGKAKK